MPILNYVPKKTTKIDHRSEAGGYYEAKCTECSETFYPKRNSAKFCSKTCQMQAWRRKRTAAESEVASEVIMPDLFAHDLGGLISKLQSFAPNSTELHGEMLGKSVHIMCAAILPKQSYTHELLPYTVYGLDGGQYGIIKKLEWERKESMNSMEREATRMEKEMEAAEAKEKKDAEKLARRR